MKERILRQIENGYPVKTILKVEDITQRSFDELCIKDECFGSRVLIYKREALDRYEEYLEQEREAFRDLFHYGCC